MLHSKRAAATDEETDAGRRGMMTDQDFYVFQADVEGSAVAYTNQEDGSTVVTCSDGTLIRVDVNGESRVIE